MTPLLGFTPDIDPTTPGAMPVVRNLIPTQRGMKSAPSGVTASAALATECRGIAVLQKTSGTTRTIAGTQTRLFQLDTTTWATASGTYVGSSDNRWSFAQFGDVSLASNYTEQIQYATATTFTAIAGAPKAKILVGVPNFVVALNTADATASVTYGTTPDRWWCCAFQDPTSWTVNVTTQATSGRLIGTGGEITAGAAFGNGLVVFKKRDMFLGQYAGPPTVFDFQRIPGDQGCVGPEAVADIGGALFFVGDDNLWIYDGSRPRPVGDGIVRRWFFDSISAVHKKNSIVRYDASNGHVWIFFPFNTTTTGRPDYALVYHIPTQKWGAVASLFTGGSPAIEAAVNYISQGVTWDNISSISTAWDGLLSQPWDSENWQVNGRVLGLVNSGHFLHTLNGFPEIQTFRTQFFGSEQQASSVSRLYARFFVTPSVGSACTGITQASLGSAVVGTSTAGQLANGKYDIRQSGRLHQFNMFFNGNTEIIGVDVPLKSAGQR